MDFEVYKNALMKPAETFAKEEKKASIKGGVVNFLIGAILASILASISAVVFTLGIGALAVPFIVVGVLVSALVGSFIVIGVLHLILVNLFNKKGKFEEFYYVASLPYVLIAPLGMIPFIGILFSLYGLYLLYLAAKQVYSL